MDNFFANFLDDYFAECEEHITTIRKYLLSIEPLVNQSQIDRSILDKLFANFHSVKGLSGMVGLKEAEQLAHEMESYLRDLRDQKVSLTTEGMDALIDGSKMLEQVITTHRTQNPMPDIVPVINKLQTIFYSNSAPKITPEITETITEKASEEQPITSAFTLPSLKLKPEEINQIELALNNGDKAWQFQFIAGKGKTEQGINVNSIRERLQGIGELIHASPRMMDNGSVSFNFVIISNVSETTFAAWEADGLIYAPYVKIKEISEEINIEISEDEPRENVKIQAEISSVLPTTSPIIPTAPSASPAPVYNNPVTTSAPSNFVRVDLAKLDDLMRMVGELVTTRARLEDKLKNLKNRLPAVELRTLRETHLTLERQLRDLREGVMQVRLVQIGEIFTRMQFVIRDLAKENQKQITLELSGQNTKIDKFVVERMMNPMMHLVRNAVSHGLESEIERQRCGKPIEGKIALRAFTAGEMVVIEVEDDGRGVDVEAVINRAKQQGLIDELTPTQQIDNSTILDIICSPCFSTREQADLTSGRGVGMAVVKNTVTELGGFITLDTEIGKGTRLTIQLPLTLSIANALIVSVCGQYYAIPQSSVREVLAINQQQITLLENNEIIAHRGAILPLVRLALIFNLIPGNQELVNLKTPNQTSPSTSQSSNLHLIVVGNGLNAVAIAVDRIIGQQEIVVRPLTDPLVQVNGITGATELGDGRVVLIVDTLALNRMGNAQVQIKNGKF